ncbi:MAG: uncharacterized protein QG608_3874 [Actinomycetota bacterium]|nr:uncharacterized protein [Actinomycetota bacterium]
MTGEPRRSVIDTCSLVYDSAGWVAYLHRLAEHAPEYLSVFARSFVRCLGVEPAVWERLTGQLADPVARAAALEAIAFDLPAFDLDEYLERRAGEGVVGEIAMGSAHGLADGTTVNERLAAMAQRSAGRLHPWGGVVLRDPQEALKELQHCLDLGMRGFNVIPFLDDVDVTDPVFRPVFELADRHRLGLWLHTGHHFARRTSAEVCTWRHVDVLASRYPQLHVVVGHAGWPWIREMTTIAMRHPNVMLEISSHRPRTFGLAGSGWESLLFHGPRALARSVMFGTSTWVNPVPIGVLVEELLSLDLPEEVLDLWLHGNAARLLGVIEGPS